MDRSSPALSGERVLTNVSLRVELPEILVKRVGSFQSSYWLNSITDIRDFRIRFHLTDDKPEFFSEASRISILQSPRFPTFAASHVQSVTRDVQNALHCVDSRVDGRDSMRFP